MDKRDISPYSTCECGGNIRPVWFEEAQYDSKYGYKTGKVRTACSHLECDECLKSITVDDTFDGPWRDK